MTKIIFFFFVFQLSLSAFAEPKGAEFKDKFLFSYLKKPAKKAQAEQEVSKCFKLNKASLEVLQGYDSCRKDPKLEAPLDEAIGNCTRKDGANAYFYEDIKECEAARTEWVDGLAP